VLIPLRPTAAFVGHPKLVDYTSTKGAIVGFTRALSNQLVKDKGIRVNAVVRAFAPQALALSTHDEAYDAMYCRHLRSALDQS
jgi:NAD(P)-dependent dehydrogenase (short-subunit alcohol dehydrogenase family)